MKLLTSLFGGGSGSALTTSLTADGAERALPYSEIARLLWSYFLNNGLYDELRLVGYFLNEANLKAIRNPAQRVVKFYTDTIWPGRLPDALPLDLVGNESLADPIAELWKWSNWQANKQLLVRLAAVLGECYVKVAQPPDKPERVYLQLIRPEYVPDDGIDTDEQGNITYLRVDIPQSRREGNKLKFYTYTEVWEKAAGRARIWRHEKGQGTAVEQLGTPAEEYGLQETWGIDFVPWVRAMHLDIGEDRGVGAFLLQLDKIDEANRLATRLHSVLFRHNDVTWALKSNMVDAATGRPLPPPRVGTTTNADGNEVVDLAGEQFIRLPGMSELQSLVPDLNYGDHLAVLNAHMAELENDLPELRYFRLQEAPDLSGRAIRLLMRPAVLAAGEVRGNLEDALVRAQKMALTIGQNAGIWQNLGSYDDGDLEHGFAERPILDGGRLEEAEIWKAERDAGLSLITALRRSGWTDEQIEELEADYQRQQAMEQAGMAAALMEAQAQFDAGQDGAAQAAAVTQEAPAATPENIESDKGLNGAQINAAVELLQGVTNKTLAPDVALELLISLGIQRERAQRMVATAQAFDPATAVPETAVFPNGDEDGA